MGETISTNIIKQGYKKTKLGLIPNDWEVTLLEKLAERGSGHTPNKKVPAYYDGGIKWISLADSSKLDQGLIEKTEFEISEDGIANSSAVLHPKGTVVLSRDAGVGKSAVMAEDMAVSQHFIVWTCKENLSNWYLYYHLQYRKPFFERMAVGSTIKTIGLSLFKKLQIPCPSLKEQQKIASILSTWDSALKKTQQLIEIKQQLKKGLMQQLITGKKRLDGFDGNWEYKKLENVLDYEQPTKYLVKSVNYSEDYSTPVLTAGKTFLLGYTNENEGTFNKGLPVIIFDDFTTANKYVDFPFKIKSSAAKILKPASKDVNVRFVFEAMQLLDFSPENHKRYWISQFSKLKIPIPVKQEQDSIAAFIEKIDGEIEFLEKKQRLLKDQKKGLMQQLLTGKKRVNF